MMTAVPASLDVYAPILDADQLVASTSVPLPRAVLSPRAQGWLWALRAFTVVLAVLVLFVFVVGML